MAYMKCSGGASKKLIWVKPQTATLSFASGGSRTFTISGLSEIAVIWTQAQWGQDHTSMYYIDDGTLTAIKELSYFKITSFSGLSYTYKNSDSGSCNLKAADHVVYGYA